MQDLTEHDYRRALRVAARLLDRFDDPTTSNARDDLAQEAAVALWRGRSRLRDRKCLDAYVRTIVHRLRGRALRRARRRERVLFDDAAFADPPRPLCGLRAGSPSLGDDDVVIDSLDVVLGGVTASLVRDFYGGATCRELAERHGLSDGAVRARIHRGRRRLRTAFQSRARRVGSGDVAPGSTAAPASFDLDARSSDPC